MFKEQDEVAICDKPGQDGVALRVGKVDLVRKSGAVRVQIPYEQQITDGELYWREFSRDFPHKECNVPKDRKEPHRFLRLATEDDRERRKKLADALRARSYKRSIAKELDRSVADVQYHRSALERSEERVSHFAKEMDSIAAAIEAARALGFDV